MGPNWLRTTAAVAAIPAIVRSRRMCKCASCSRASRRIASAEPPSPLRVPEAERRQIATDVPVPIAAATDTHEIVIVPGVLVTKIAFTVLEIVTHHAARHQTSQADSECRTHHAHRRGFAQKYRQHPRELTPSARRIPISLRRRTTSPQSWLYIRNAPTSSARYNSIYPDSSERPAACAGSLRSARRALRTS